MKLNLRAFFSSTRPGLAFLFAWAAFSPAAGENLDSLVAHAPGLDTYPQASALTIFDRTYVTLDRQGFSYRRREFLLKILDERAKDRYGDQSVRFDADRDTVIIEVAKTRTRDGQWIEPESDAFTLTSAPEVQWASAYSQAKQRNVSFPGLDVDAAIYFAYRIEPKAGAEVPKYPQEGGVVLFGGYEPVLEKSYTIEFPDTQKINYELQNSKVQPQVSATIGARVYHWEFRNLEQVIREPNAVGLGDLVPRLLWTTFPDWEALGTYVAQRFWEKVDSSSHALAAYAQLTAAPQQGKPALMNAALWVVRNIRNVNLPLGRVGYEPNSADRVWENKYGDPRDKAVLLSALAGACGFNSIPAIVTNSSAPFCDLPVLQQFAHVVLAIPTGDDTLWVDPTAEHFEPGTLPYSCTYGKACLLTHGAPLLLELGRGDPGIRGARTEIVATLTPGGDLRGSASCTPFADLAARARAALKDQKQQEREIYTQQMGSRIGQGTLVTSFTTTDPSDLVLPFVARIEFESPGYAVVQGAEATKGRSKFKPMMFVEFPANPFDFGVSGFYPSLPEVKYPILLPIRSKFITDISLEVPDGFSLTYVAPPLVVENAYLHLERMMRHSDRTLTWTQIVEIRADKVPLSDYALVREAYQSFMLPKTRLAILEGK